jgi:ATP-binding cassette subfamily C protein
MARRVSSLRLVRLLHIIDRRTKIGLAGMFGLMLISALLETVGVGVVLPLFQLLVAPAGAVQLPVIGAYIGGVQPEEYRSLLPVICFAALTVFVLKSTVSAVVVFTQNRFVLNAQAAFARDLLRTYLERPYVFHLQRNSAQLIRNVQILSVRLFVKGLLPLLQIGLEVIVAVGILALLLAIHPAATITIAILMAVTGGVFYWLVQSRLRNWGEQTIRYDGEILRWIQQALGSVKATKLAGKQEFFADAVARHSFARARAMTWLNTAPHLPRLFIEVVAVTGLVAVVLASLAAGNEDVQSLLPLFAVFGAAAARLVPVFTKVISNLSLLRENAATIDILWEDLHGRPPLARLPTRPALREAPAFSREFRLERVTFRYPDRPNPALDQIDLSIRPGDSVALVGRSGAGKTTLVDVVLGILEPSEGRLLVDGVDLRAHLEAWQHRIGYVPQDVYLLDDTLRRNVALGVDAGQIDSARIAQAVKLAGLETVVAGLPRGLDTMVGERGTWLSGGQKQRVGIARALYQSPDILVMDEATSALDAETEREIGAALVGFQNVLTTIVIAHRLTTVRQCRRVVLLDSGRIAAQGTFEELMTSNPDFQRLAGVEGELSAAS